MPMPLDFKIALSVFVLSAAYILGRLMFELWVRA